MEHDKHAGQNVLVWCEKRRDGSPGATRRRLLKPVTLNGKKQAKVRWQFAGQKTDEPLLLPWHAGRIEANNRCS